MSKVTKKQMPRKRTWTGRDSFGPELNPTTSTPCEQSNSSPAVQEKHCKPTYQSSFRFSDGDFFTDPMVKGSAVLDGMFIEKVLAKENRRHGYHCATPDAITSKEHRRLGHPKEREGEETPFCSLQLADFVADNNLPVISYMRSAFDHDGTLRSEPSKLHEHTVEAFYEYVDVQKLFVATILAYDQFECQDTYDRLDNRADGRDHVDQILRSKKLTPLFLYCVKRRFGFAWSEKDLADAISQYMNFPVAYDQAWRWELPPGFGEIACKAYLGLNDPELPERFLEWVNHKDPSEKHT